MRALTDVESPAWPDLERLLEAAPAAAVLEVARSRGEACLVSLQVTAASTMGALALHTGGVTVDGGWLRILGGGTTTLPSLIELNPGLQSGPGFLTIAVDVLGGRFAINGGALPGEPGDVAYWAPDSLGWLALDVGYTQFVHWAIAGGPHGGLSEFYADLRWAGWPDEVAAVPLSHGIMVVPPLFTRESHPIEKATRGVVPWSELNDFFAACERRLGPG